MRHIVWMFGCLLHVPLVLAGFGDSEGVASLLAKVSGSGPDAPQAITTVSIPEWLDSVKPGYGNKFSSSFEEAGAEDASDIADLDEKAMADLESRLESHGAKSIHISKIKAAITAMSLSDTDLLPAEEAKKAPSVIDNKTREAPWSTLSSDICASSRRERGTMFRQWSGIIETRTKVAVVVPTYINPKPEHAHTKYALALARSSISLRPGDVELFFVFSNSDDEKTLAQLLAKDGLYFEDGGLHSLNLQRHNPKFTLGSSNLPSYKKWWGVNEVFRTSDSFRYVVACDDESLFTPHSSSHSLFTDLHRKMQQKEFHCTRNIRRGLLMERGADIYTKDYEKKPSYIAADKAEVLVNLSSAFVDKNGTIGNVTECAWCFSWWHDLPAYGELPCAICGLLQLMYPLADLSSWPEFLCDIGLEFPARNWAKSEWHDFYYFDFILHQYFLMARHGYRIKEVSVDRADPEKGTTPEYCAAANPLWATFPDKCSGAFMAFHCDRTSNCNHQ
jgi:hypothetical protein